MLQNYFQFFKIALILFFAQAHIRKLLADDMACDPLFFATLQKPLSTLSRFEHVYLGRFGRREAGFSAPHYSLEATFRLLAENEAFPATEITIERSHSLLRQALDIVGEGTVDRSLIIPHPDRLRFPTVYMFASDRRWHTTYNIQHFRLLYSWAKCPLCKNMIVYHTIKILLNPGKFKLFERIGILDELTQFPLSEFYFNVCIQAIGKILIKSTIRDLTYKDKKEYILKTLKKLEDYYHRDIRYPSLCALRAELNTSLEETVGRMEPAFSSMRLALRRPLTLGT